MRSGARPCRAGAGPSSRFLLGRTAVGWPAGAGRDADAFTERLVEGHVAPVEGGLLAVVLAEPAGDGRLHELLAQVEGVRVLVDAELVEDLVDVSALDEVVDVERVDPVGIREDADVGVG